MGTEEKDNEDQDIPKTSWAWGKKKKREGLCQEDRPKRAGKGQPSKKGC